MLILALDSAVTRCSATIVAGGGVVAGCQRDLERGHASVLPVMVQDCLRDAGLQAADLDLVAVTVGPGSFTGIRGGVALAQGIAVAADRPVVGVTVGEALADSLPLLGGRTLWCATTSRRGRIFLEIADTVPAQPTRPGRSRGHRFRRRRQPARRAGRQRHADRCAPAHGAAYRRGGGTAVSRHDPAFAGRGFVC